MRPYCIGCLGLRFWAKVDQSGGPEACWLWRGKPNKWGYGTFYFAGRVRRATHVSLFLTTGALPAPGVMALHRCDTPRCVNPAHLFLGTMRDNMRDAVAKGRHRNGIIQGEVNGKSKLTAERVRLIRHAHAHGTAVKTLAAAHGVSIRAIYYVVNRRTWKHVA